MRHSGARSKTANPESSQTRIALFWIPGPRLQRVPE